jgi:plastocyanin
MNRDKRLMAGVFLAATLLLVIVGCSDDQGARNHPSTTPGTSPAATDSVTVRNLAFSPASISVPAGTTVTWTNQDTPPHDVTFADGEHSERLDTGATYERTFAATGSFDYVCSIHPQMNGRVVVTATP